MLRDGLGTYGVQDGHMHYSTLYLKRMATITESS
jgi:hypothetical protein